VGVQQTVSFAGGAAPAWPAVQEVLARHGFAVQMRMIDGQLAFPDEVPPESWGELRLGTPGGMVTVRREGADRLSFVVWGNADEGLRQGWNALAWAFAEAGGGVVETDQGALDAAAFRRQAALPGPLRP
jgi:hypothetical protein